MRSRVLEPCTMIRVQGWDSRAGLPSRAEDAWGVAWPNTTGALTHGQNAVVCIGPTEWLAMAQGMESAALLQKLNEMLTDSPFRATDVSASLARVEISGPHARTLLSKACALDLDPNAFGAGHSARTRFAGMPVVVCCIEASTFECIIAVSYRDYLVAWLADAGADVVAAS